jgi:ubiquinone/menaquinone biosynthesis C-methylase UbiE
MRKELCQHWERMPNNFDYIEKEDKEIIVNMILADKINSVVEFACGTGIIPKMLRDKGYNGEYLGTDITENFLVISREHNPSERFIFADLDEIPFKDNEFEAVVICTGLGYLADIEKTFTELKRITSRYIYIDQYNLFAEKNDLRFLRGEGMGNQYNKKWFDEMLARVGLKNVFEVSVTNGKDYEAIKGTPSSKINHIYKLC